MVFLSKPDFQKKRLTCKKVFGKKFFVTVFAYKFESAKYTYFMCKL